MNWYKFRQNNSGGSFVRNANLDVVVLIQAPTSLSANARALDMGIYFNGVTKGRDCSCCGDRWYEVDEDDVVTPETVESFRSPKERVIFHPFVGNKFTYRDPQDLEWYLKTQFTQHFEKRLTKRRLELP